VEGNLKNPPYSGGFFDLKFDYSIIYQKPPGNYPIKASLIISLL